MRAWMIWLIIACVLAVLALLKVGIHVMYQNQKFQVKLLIGKIRVLIPKAKEEAGEKAAPEKKLSKAAKKKGIDPRLRAAINHWQEIFELLGRVLTAPTLDKLKLVVYVGGEDPEACAMLYGRICAAVGGLLAPIENTFEIKKRDIHVYSCFDRDNLMIEAETSITVRIYEVVALAAAALRLGWTIYREAKDNKKVG